MVVREGFLVAGGFVVVTVGMGVGLVVLVVLVVLGLDFLG